MIWRTRLSGKGGEIWVVAKGAFIGDTVCYILFDNSVVSTPPTPSPIHWLAQLETHYKTHYLQQALIICGTIASIASGVRRRKKGYAVEKKNRPYTGLI